jgi:ABC-type branched-subunit amino acid transport system substrate-binding protein
VPNIEQLIHGDEVLAIIGNVGTPTAIAAVPLINEAQVPLVGAFTGAGVLRQTPPDRYVINWRASYQEETAAMVDALVDTVGLDLDEIALFTQRDGYGDAGYAGALLAMRRHGLPENVFPLHTRYTRNTLNVEGALAQILDSPQEIRAVIMVGAYAPCARLIELSRGFDFNPLFLNVSFVGSHSLAGRLGDLGDGVVITQVVPPLGADLPAVRDYHRGLAEHGNGVAARYVSLEGYIAARMLVCGLNQIDGPIGREEIVEGLESLRSFDLGDGLPITLSPAEHQASHRVWPTVISEGDILPLAWEDLTEEGTGP